MIELHNIYDVKEVLFSTTLELIAGTNPNCQVQLHLPPNIFLHQTKFFLCTSVGALKSVYGWAHITCFQQ